MQSYLTKNLIIFSLFGILYLPTLAAGKIINEGEEETFYNSYANQANVNAHIITEEARERISSERIKVYKDFEKSMEETYQRHEQEIKNLNSIFQNLRAQKESLQVQRETHIRELQHTLDEYEMEKKAIMASSEYKMEIQPYLDQRRNLLLTNKPIDMEQVRTAKEATKQAKSKFFNDIDKKTVDLKKQSRSTLSLFDIQLKEIENKIHTLDSQHFRMLETHESKVKLLTHYRDLSLDRLDEEERALNQEFKELQDSYVLEKTGILFDK